MKMHILVVVNGLSKKEEASVLSLRNQYQQQNGSFRCDLIYVLPLKRMQSSMRLPFCRKGDIQSSIRHANAELSRCANVFGCADSQQWIAMGAIPQEALTLAKKLSVQSVLLSSNEFCSLVNYTHSPQLPRIYTVNQYFKIYGLRTEKSEYIFNNSVVIA